MSSIAQTPTLYAGTQSYAPKAPFLSQVRPWLLQGALLVCVTRGNILFFEGASADGYQNGGGVSGTVVYLLVTTIWMITLFITMVRRRSTPVTLDRVLLLSLPVLAIVSTCWSVAPRVTAASGFHLLLLTLLGLYIANSHSIEEQMQIFMLTGIIAGAASLAAAAIIPQIAIDHADHAGALQGIFTQKNSCGSFMLFLFTPALFLRRVGSHGRLKTCAYGLFCATILLLSQSGTAIILFAVIIILTSLLGILNYFRNRDALFIAGALIFLAIPVFLIIAANQAAITLWLGKDPTFSGRTYIWQAVLVCIAKKPWLGYGYSAFFSSRSTGAGDLSTSLGWAVPHAHNGFLMVWLDLGLVGFAIFAFTLFRAAGNMRRIWAHGLGRKAGWYAILIVLTLLANTDERGLASANDLTWLFFVVACAGLCRLAREASTLASWRYTPKSAAI